MKTKLDKTTSSIKEEIQQHLSWAKGFMLKGRRVYHPYTLVKK